MKKYLFVLIISIGFNVQAGSLETFEKSIVKVRSYLCGVPNIRLEGTGFLVRNKAEVQVITSEHVVLHDSSKTTCHEIIVDGLTQPIAVKFLKASVLNGVAILQIDNPAETVRSLALTSANLEYRNSKKLQLAALGIPQRSNQIQILKSGILISEESSRSLIPDVGNLIEASNLPVEFGMSGGILLSETPNGDFQLLGLLSHQVLKRQVGGATQVAVPEGVSSDLALAIPVAELLKFLKSDVPTQIVWQRSVVSQLSGGDDFVFGPLLFKRKKEKMADLFSGIGGADGVGIGGADGIGIGGVPSQSENFEGATNIQVNLRTFEGPSALEFNDSTLESWYKYLLRGERIHIPFLRNLRGNSLNKVQSFEQLLTDWRRNKSEPLSLRSNILDQSQRGMQLFIRQARQVLFDTQILSDRIKGSLAKGWLSRVREKTLLVQSFFISQSEFADFIDNPENSNYWAAIYQEDFEAATALESSLYSLKESLSRLTGN